MEYEAAGERCVLESGYVEYGDVGGFRVVVSGDVDSTGVFGRLGCEGSEEGEMRKALYFCVFLKKPSRKKSFFY